MRPVVNATPSSATAVAASAGMAWPDTNWRAAMYVSNTTMQPHTSAENRHPNGVNPKRRMPTAINHFPPGGWTTPPFSTPRRSISAASGA